jgi:hypothetical protein
MSENYVKFLEISENPDRTVDVTLNKPAVAGYPREKLQSALRGLLLKSSGLLDEASKNLPKDEVLSINEGSLYDQLVFSVGLYVGDSDVRVNYDFGRAVDPGVLLSDGVAHIAEVLTVLQKSLNFEELLENL